MTLSSLCRQCNCKARQAKWNALFPGLGDAAAIVFNPIQKMICNNAKEESNMPSVLKPDMKAIVWLAIGALVVPLVRSKLNF